MKDTDLKRHWTRIGCIAVVLAVMLTICGCARPKNNNTGKTAAEPTTTELTTTESTAAESVTAGSVTAGITDEEAAAINVTDMMGRQITLDAPAERIVVLAAADCEILYAVGAGNTLVGRGEYCNYPEEVLDVPSVQSGAETNVEQIIALKPQVVIMSIMAQSKEQVPILEDAGIKVVAVNAQDIEGVYTAIELIGKITGKDAEAGEVVENMKATFAELSQKAAGDASQTIYYEVSPLEYGLWTAGSGTFMNEFADMLGLTNAFADVQGWGEISQEQVIERNPDYIVTTAMSFGEGLKPVDEILGRKGWEKIKAIVNKNVLNVDSDEISRPGPRLVNAFSDMYDFIYGDTE